MADEISPSAIWIAAGMRVKGDEAGMLRRTTDEELCTIGLRLLARLGMNTPAAEALFQEDKYRWFAELTERINDPDLARKFRPYGMN